jgi:undecaprenyl-diphosphatase
MYTVDGRLLWLIALGSIPAAIVGVLFNSWFEDNVRQAWLVAITMSSVALVLLAGEWYARHRRTLADLNAVDAAIIGTAQAIALVPGVSRSGATITGGLFRELRREDAARFAFLLGTPAFIGAALLKARDLSGESGHEWTLLAIGFVCSAVVGFAVIHFLLRYLRTRTLLVFVFYRFAVAALVLIVYAIRA